MHVGTKVHYKYSFVFHFGRRQDWTNVWPTSGVYRHSVAPFPLRMGVVKSDHENNFIVPDKSVNVELLKISNFLHLTPKHVEKHCEVLHQFCTEWPEGTPVISRKTITLVFLLAKILLSQIYYRRRLPI